MNVQVFAITFNIISLNTIVKTATSVAFLLLLTPTFSEIIRDKNGQYYAEFIVVNDGRLANVLSYYENIDKRGCVIKCLQDVRCKTVNFNFKEGKCETCDTDFDIRDAYIHDTRWLNFGTPNKVDDGWSSWTVTPCSASCGGGHKGKYRDCTDPKPRHGGGYCKGKNFARVSCNEHKCPVDGSYGLWGTWTACNVTCGNGTQERTRSCDSPTPAHNGKTCIGAHNEIRDCTTDIPCEVTYKFFAKEAAITLNTLVTTIPQLYKTYLVSFDVFIALDISMKYRSILQLTTGAGSGEYGTRTPAVWVKIINDQTYFLIRSAVNRQSELGHGYESTKAPLNKWVNVVVQQYNSKGNWKYSIRIDGEEVENVQNTAPQDFKNVKVYASNPWQSKAIGKIRNLNIYTGRDPCVKVDLWVKGRYLPYQDGVHSWFACSEICKALSECVAWTYYPRDTQCVRVTSIIEFKTSSFGSINGKRDCPE